MRTTLSIFTLLLSMGISAQRIVIVDSLSGKPLSRVLIQWKKGKTYTGSDGVFVYKRKYGQLQISCEGYQTKNLIPQQDTVYLIPFEAFLPEITIYTKQKIKTVKPLKGNEDGFALSPGTGFFILIKPKNTLLNKKIVSFGFKISPLPFLLRYKIKNKKMTVQFDIYENQNGKPGKKIYTSNPLEITIPKKGILEHKIIQDIFLKKQGLFFSVKNLGVEQKSSEKFDIYDYLTIATMSKKSQYYDAESFVSFVKKLKNGKIREFFMDISNFNTKYMPKGSRNYSFLLKYL